MNKIKKALYMVAELTLRICISPYLRCTLLRLLGARIGSNVRIYETCFINLENGFRNLNIEDDVHIGTGCMFDLCAPIFIAQKSTISLGTTILTHSDPGSHHGSALCVEFPPFNREVKIGKDCWIGCNSTIMPGVTIGDRTLVGACSLVSEDTDPNSMYFGIPAKRVRALQT